jgi:HNH endonuclease
MSTTFPVQPGACDDCYCPYCNGYALDDMTDEHVIPRAIGGDHQTVIRTCRRCNNDAGSKLDTLICRHSGLRATAMCSGQLMTRHERHESTARLKDGTRLLGCFYWIKVDNKSARVGFEPDKIQPDQSQWVSEHGCKDIAKLPSNINVYREEMLDAASYTFTAPSDGGLEPAMVKILLGISYMAWGTDVLRQPAFDSLRDCLMGTLHPRVTVSWVDSREDLNSKLPFEVLTGQHTIWGECTDDGTFRGGVSLFGTVIAEIAVSEFGYVLQGRCLSVPIPWLPH